MQGVPRVFEAWTSLASRAQLRQFILNLSVPESILQPYIVRHVDTVTSPVVECNNQDGATAEVQYSISSSLFHYIFLI